MRRVTTVLSILAIAALPATAAWATGDTGEVLLQSGDNQTDPHATVEGAMWLDTGSGPVLIPDRWDNVTNNPADCDRSSDINVEVLAGLSPSNLQLMANPNNSSFTSILLLSIPNPNVAAVPNSAWWDMNFGGDNGQLSDCSGGGLYIMPGSTGSAYFRVYAWTGLYNSYADAAAHGAYINDSGIYQGVTCMGSIMPIPNMTWPAMVLHPALLGDANGDNKVDINDLTIVLAHYGQSGAEIGWSTGDFNNDDKVNINDLTIVLANYGQSIGAAGAGLAAVPEPGTFVLVAAGLVGLPAGAWRIRKR